jgi:hypothetical protein
MRYNSNISMQFLTHASDRINFYFSIFGLTSGIFFNAIFSLLYIQKRLIIRTESDLLLNFISIVDSCLLLLNFVFVQFFPSIHLNFFSMSIFCCKFFHFLLKFLALCSSWLQVCLAFDRFNRPNNIKLRKDLIFYSIICILLFLVCIPDFFYELIEVSESFDLNQANITYRIECSSTNYNFLLLNDFMFALFRSWLPLFLIVSFNLISFLRIKKIVTSIAILESEFFAETTKCHSQTFAIIRLQIYFLVLSLPLFVYFIVMHEYKFELNRISENIVIFEVVAISLANTFPIAAFLNNLFSNVDYRREFFAIFHF